eukprot:TRINITY_DN4569_c0_g1_i4.p1 TRINITY_DN4569_c0_g1~~TRINITY_DN4569_c0_g1_i4.p1  ORF type:complete len:174 (-),score=23.73 TRINITY_DN4569_c0_g1_i4:44-565(-)
MSIARVYSRSINNFTLRTFPTQTPRRFKSDAFHRGEGAGGSQLPRTSNFKLPVPKIFQDMMDFFAPKSRFVAPDGTKKKLPIDLIHEVPPIVVHGVVAACDGGGGPLGHPRVFVKMETAAPRPCGYCGLRFIRDKRLEEIMQEKREQGIELKHGVDFLYPDEFQKFMDRNTAV